MAGSIYAVCMEEVPDLEPQVWGGILEERTGGLLMTNEEY